MLILASQSPSRHQLLGQFHIPFEVEPINLDETPHSKEKPRFYVLRIAKEKALAATTKHLGQYVLAADTIVALGTRILRKAKDEEEARYQMQLLSGRRHRVYTSLCLVLPQGRAIQRLAVTHVAFKVLEPREINFFIKSQEWKNVAVYRHEGVAARFIRFMRGLPSTIAGLPLFDTYQLLRGQGLIKIDML